MPSEDRSLEGGHLQTVKSPLVIVNSSILIRVGPEDFAKLVENLRPRGAIVIKGRARHLLRGRDILILVHGGLTYLCVLRGDEELLIAPDIEAEDIKFATSLPMKLE